MKKILSTEEKKEILELYNNGFSNKELSEKFCLHRTTIQRFLKKNNIELHKRKSNLSCNKKFFCSYNKESCYWAGFILADGYIRKNSNNLHIKIKKEDDEHLKNFLRTIGVQEVDVNKLIKYKYNYVYFDLFIEDLVFGLKNFFSIGNKKSLIALVDNKIPENLLSHFIRGYFDGDGSISNSKKYPVVSFTGTLDVLNVILDFILAKKIKKSHRAKIFIRYHNIIGSFAYSGFPFLEKFFEIIYKDSYEKIELRRKKEKIINFLEPLLEE